MTAKDLKNALLQEAVQGKLVPQIASEGNARDLLNEIRKARNSELVSESKNKPKKEKPLPEITEEEIPFDIPENWSWCRLGEICNFENGDRSSNYPVEIDYKNDGIPFFGAADMINNQLVFTDNLRFISQEKFDSLRSGKLKDKDYVMLLRGAVGKWAQFFKYDKYSTGFINAQMVIIRANSNVVSFIKVLFNSPVFEIFLREKTTGTAVAQMSAKDLATLAIPLPPLAEQKRIVAAIEKFMPLIEEYGKKESELKAFNEQIGRLTKKAILQEAVQGKLVPQIAAEGNAKDLLEEIKKEKAKPIKEGKIKKEKPLPEISEDEIPFDIPENWCWCRLGEIVYNNGQKTPDKEFSYIDIGSIDNLHQKLNDKENFVSPKQAPSRARKIVKKGDIIYATVRPYLHNMCIIDKDFEKEPIASTGFAVLACYPQINNQYLFYYLLSPSFDNYANDTENSKGVAYPAINDDKLYKGVVPLPPLAEQKRIVAAIEKLLPLCEKI